MPKRDGIAATPPAASSAGDDTGRSLVERVSPRRPSETNTRPSPVSPSTPSRPRPARTDRSAPPMPAVGRDAGSKPPSMPRASIAPGEADERADLGAKARHRAEPRPQPRHRRRAEHLRQPARRASGVARRPSSRRVKVFVLQMSSASGWLGAAGVCGSAIAPARPAAWSTSCSRLTRTATAARSRSSGRMCASPIRTTTGCRRST